MKRTTASQQLIRSATVAVAAVAMLSTMNASATATESASPTERVDQALAQAGVSRETPGALVSSDGAIDINHDHPSASIAIGGRLAGISLIKAGVHVTKTEHARSNDSERSYGDVGPSTDALVRANDGGVQIITVMRGPRASNIQRYDLELPDGARLVPNGRGFALVESDGAVSGAIDAPWAKDATGRELPTRYTLDDNVLMQETDMTGAQYPVVADPRITFGLGVYLNMWGWEVRSTAVAVIALFGTGVVVSCTQTGSIPNAALRTLAVLVCGAAAVNLRSIFQAVVDVYRNGVSDGQCYQDKIFGPGNAGGFRTVSATNCG
ncbi:hypothetical protein [Plantactinospora soyae]|uniref:Uncharacterized protein n=1 Tax=Plantactinospora soyae TaxID=1544732 RepID=A0A927M3D8_9ACTN|nr:hypothetical protein [Plantactinospora soyae]MBE1486056.1 hypothetical protein [Plantactinospora soyae]